LLEIVGLITGQRMVGVLFVGGQTPFYTPPPPVPTLLELAWLLDYVRHMRLDTLLARLINPYVLDPLLAGQVVVWTVAGYLGGRLSKQGPLWSRPNVLALAASAIVLFLGHLFVPWGLAGISQPPLTVAGTVLVSALVSFAAYPLLAEVNRLAVSQAEG
jgi:hypothetical protein